MTGATRSATQPVPVTVDLPDGRCIRGTVSPRLNAMYDAFVQNFVVRRELGAAVTVYVDGRLEADLWGGVADARTGRRWTADTPSVIFSCTKGVLAICAHRLVDRGLLDLDAPIARYWPEFAENGKERITVRDAMSHRAGLASLDVRLSRAEALDWQTVVRAIERQAPLHAPSDGHFYHVLTYGWIVGEVIRRATGRLPGEEVSSALSGPLGLDLWIGVPARILRRVARLEPPLPDEDSADAALAARLAADHPLVERSLSLGDAWGFPTERGVVTFNDPSILRGQVPGANGVASARALAKLFAACVAPVAGPTIISSARVADALRTQSSGRQLSGMPDDGAVWGTGFQLASPPAQPMLGPASFGHAGAGGQLAFADARHRVGFAYLANQMGGYGDARAKILTEALRGALETTADA